MRFPGFKERKCRRGTDSSVCDSGIEETNPCQEISCDGIKVVVDSLTHGRICFLSHEINTEWCAYVYGIVENKTIRIDKIFLPEQEVGYAIVKPQEEAPRELKNRIRLGFLHSHHTMGLHSLSSGDKEYSSANTDLSILINKKKEGQGEIEYQAFVRKILPCDNMKYCFIEVPITIDYAKHFGFDYKNKIKEIKPVVTSISSLFPGIEAYSQCEYCHAWFYTKETLQQHQKNTHGIGTELPKGDSLYGESTFGDLS